MPRSIERSHASRVLDPRHDVLQFSIDIATSRKKLIEMLPIHAYEMGRSAFALFFNVFTAFGQKANKLFPSEPAGTLGKLAVADLSFAGRMTIDANVVRRVNEDDVRPIVRHQSLKDSFGRCITAMNVMTSEFPDIAELANLHPRLRAGIIDIRSEEHTSELQS